MDNRIVAYLRTDKGAQPFNIGEETGDPWTPAYAKEKLKLSWQQTIQLVELRPGEVIVDSNHLILGLTAIGKQQKVLAEEAAPDTNQIPLLF